MRILFLSPHGEDYLADGVFHGLREVYGSDVVDYPKREFMYSGCRAEVMNAVRGGAFTLYGLLDDLPVDRSSISEKVRLGYFDLVVVGNVYSSWGMMLELLPHLRRENTILLDGADTGAIFPFSGKWWRNSSFWLLPSVHQEFAYYKREWNYDTVRYRSYKMLPYWLCKKFYSSLRLNRISFCIPESKIARNDVRVRSQVLASDIVDPEVATVVGAGVERRRFDLESDYYEDLDSSLYGITTKRAGWDCLRHYELAARGCILCFRDLSKKPMLCAPHELTEENCIIYEHADDLMRELDSVSPDRYEKLKNATRVWIEERTTRKIALGLLSGARSNGLSI